MINGEQVTGLIKGIAAFGTVSALGQIDTTGVTGQLDADGSDWITYINIVIKGIVALGTLWHMWRTRTSKPQ